jgi:selenocysteine-specific translation elongation factor
MRRRALGILARGKDGFAQKKLMDGLKNPDQALLPPEKALQLLGNDIHSDAYPIARAMVKNAPNPTARREALRLLATDAASAPTFEAILQDKKEAPEIRQISAAALHSLKPEKLQEYARDILLDPSEHADMHQTSLTALTQFGDAELGDDKKLMNRVNRMSASGSATVKSSARQFLGKYKAKE